MERSNLTETIQGDITEFRKDSETTEVKGELANLVDRQLEARGVCGYAFDEKEVNRTWERELLGPKFYYHLLEDCGLDFWIVFKYAAHHLRAELDEKSQGNHPVGVEKLFTILTGEDDFNRAVKRFFAEVYPTHPRAGRSSVFESSSDFAKGSFPLQPLKEYFAFELTDDKLKKLEIAVENTNAMKMERFKLFDQFAERNDGNMGKIQRLMDSMGEEAKSMVFPLLLNELRINPSDVFRYFYHKDLANTRIEYIGINYKREEMIPFHTSENFETFLKITGVVSYNDIFSKEPRNRNLRSFRFWAELPEALKVALPENEKSYDGGFLFPGLDKGHDTDLMGRIVGHGRNKEIRKRFYDGYFVESPWYLISTYGAEATKNRLDAIFTPEVLEIIWRDYGQFVFAPNKKEVEKEMKKLKEISSAEGGKPAQKKGLFGLFKKG